MEGKTYVTMNNDIQVAAREFSGRAWARLVQACLRNESVSVKGGEFLIYLNQQLLGEDCVSWSHLIIARCVTCVGRQVPESWRNLMIPHSG
jgi:hypothetical protein